METNGDKDHISDTENGEGDETNRVNDHNTDTDNAKGDETGETITEQSMATPVRSSMGLLTGYRNRRIRSNWTSAMSRTQTPRYK